MQLTQLASVKTRLGIEAFDTKDDQILANAILAVSARFEKEANRSFALATNATHEFAGDETEIRVPSYPVAPGSISLFEIKSSETDGWEAQTNVDFLLRNECVISLPGPLGARQQQARVTYSGGYVLPGFAAGAGQIALPDDLEQACVEQVAWWYQRRNQLGVVSLGGQSGSLRNFPQLDLLPNVKAVLKKYERFVL
ncbi:MAG TPA: hypothetical protein VH598_06170 [Verrucomicrobiae bacterium]|nr:hypothetical protein [Verrucomicrobiae bacterium]